MPMGDASPWAWALVLAVPVCCGGLAALAAGGFAFLGAVAVWQGLLLLAIPTTAAAIAIVVWRRRRACEP